MKYNINMVNDSYLQSGFSLIEIIVSLALFSVVVTVSVGALLVLVSSNEQLQDEQSVMTNLSFALDSMTREIRTGTNYYCAGRPNYSAGGSQAIFDISDSQESLNDSVNDCYLGAGGSDKLQGISFEESGSSITGASRSRILYYFDNVSGSANQGKIMRRVGDDVPEPVTSSGIYITKAEFFVSGSNELSAGSGATYEDQPSVTIFIEAKEANNLTSKTYQIQTTVTQRTLDI